jgi:uncharacterized protein YggL (DUF469 family)
VRSINLKKKEIMAHVGTKRQRKEMSFSEVFSIEFLFQGLISLLNSAP